MTELTVLCHRFLTSQTPSGSIVAKLRTLRPGHGIRRESWA